jgi:ferredoxin
MKVEVDANTCTGCAVCTDLVPEVFELNDDNICIVKTPEVPAGLEEKVQEAADSCPVTCITVS